MNLIYLGPLTTSQAGVRAPGGPRDLVGVSIAQDQLNQSPSGPRLRVLIANGGASMAYQDSVAELIASRAAIDPTIVGVIGVGQNRNNTPKTVRILAQAGLPMVATANSVDDGYGNPFYFHVAPTDIREARVAKDYLVKHLLPGMRAVVVEATNDRYSQELAGDFTSEMQRAGYGALLRAESVTYPEPSGAKADMSPVADRACPDGDVPDLIYYTGRAEDLKGLMDGLQLKRCGRKHITILSGDDLTKYQDPIPEFVTLVYTTLTLRRHNRCWPRRAQGV